jgi:hypothetical protein
MTNLFVEYQAQKELRDSAYSMIGKLFYWCKRVDGRELPFSRTNLMRVSNIEISTSGAREVLYNYVDTNLSGHQKSTYFLKNTKPYYEVFIMKEVPAYY